MDLTSRRETFGAEDLSWLGSADGTKYQETITLDGSLFDPDDFPNGDVLSGTVLGKVTSSGLYGPYPGATEEVQTITIDATGGTYTLTYAGQTTAAIDWDATAAEVKAALEALSNIGAGDVTVTGDAGGPYTVTFGGSLGDTNVAEMTATDSLTGGAGTVTIATTTGGGTETVSDGREVAVGFLATSVRLNRSDLGDASDVFVNVGAALLWRGKVKTANLPVSGGPGHLDANARTDLAAKFRFV